MASTNKTPNYNLSQFSDDDKPSWRGDVNADNLKVDTNIHRIDAQTSDNLQNITQVKKDLTKAQSDIVSATNTANTAKSEADNSKNILDSADLKSTDDGQALRNEIRAKANTADVYSKNSADSKFATLDQVNSKADMGLAYTKAESDRRFEPLHVSETQTEIVFIGDSYFNGLGTSNGYSSSMAKVAADELKLNDHNYSVNGSGFVTGGDSNRPFLQQIQIAAQDSTYDHSKVKYVVIGGGRNDGGQPFDGYTTTMQSTILAAMNSFPNSKIIVIPNMFDNAMPGKDNAKKFGALHALGYAGSRVAIVDGAYTWGFGEGASNFSDIHPRNTLSMTYGQYIADCCEHMRREYFVDKSWSTKANIGDDFSDASLTVSLHHGMVSVACRGTQKDDSSKPGFMIGLPNLSKMGIFKAIFGYADGMNIAPLIKWDGQNIEGAGNIFGNPSPGTVLNATFSYSLLGAV